MPKLPDEQLASIMREWQRAPVMLSVADLSAVQITRVFRKSIAL